MQHPDGSVTRVNYNVNQIKLCSRKDYERVDWGDYFDSLTKNVNFCIDDWKDAKLA